MQCLLGFSLNGCGNQQQGEAPFRNSAKTTPPPIDLQRVQSNTMSFANGYAASMADAYDRVSANSDSTPARIAAIQGKGFAAAGALGNAVNPNPLAGLMDMALMVTLTRQSTEDPWAKNLFGQENVDILLAALKPRETEIWRIASNYLTADQIAELKKLAERWRKEHPEQRFVASGRLAEFAEAKQAAAGGPGLVSGVFGLIRLDPFSGLDPAVRQVEESRLLAERMFFYLQYMPNLLAWQIDATYLRMLQAPQVQQVTDNTTTVAGSTTRFVDATSRFAQTIENFRLQLPRQQATLADQLNDLVAKQRDAALMQATTQLSAIRDATVDQLNYTLSAQQNQITQNLQAVTDGSIANLYSRLRALILIAVGSLLVMLVLYRMMATAIPGSKTRR
jgi:hypothetical protein